VSATGTRIVSDTPQFVATGSIASTFTYYAMGTANAVSNSTIQATPGLLYTSTVNFGTGGALAATYTNSYFAATGSLQATGTDVQNGSAAFVGNSIGSTAIPLYIAGTAASFAAVGTISADASTTPNGSSYTYRDGYVNTVPIGGSLSANALRTAQCFANPAATSTCIAVPCQIQGGSSQLIGTGTLGATGAADAGWITCYGSLTALGQVTQNPTPILMAGVLTGTATQTVLTQGTANTLSGLATLSATCNLGIQSSAAFQGMTIASATGVNEKLGNWQGNAFGSLTALGGLFQQGTANLASVTTLLANPMVNADAIDPPERTMIRPFIDRVMLRPFIDRTMEKEP
jgi:hypothetical protein